VGFLTFGTHAPHRHARGSGHPERRIRRLQPWTPAFAGATRKGRGSNRSGYHHPKCTFSPAHRTRRVGLPERCWQSSNFYVTTPQLPQSRCTVAGVSSCERVRDFRRGNLVMPDLDLIKQAEQGCGRFGKLSPSSPIRLAVLRFLQSK
jgi:hypothetical protein